MNTQPTPDERLMAAISHGSIVIGGMGIVVGVVVWMTQKEKDPYAAWQGLQAAVYQLVGMIGIVSMWVLWTIFYFLSFIPIIAAAEQNTAEPPLIFWISLGSMLIPMGVMVIWGLYGLWGAWQTWRGQPFRYALIGRFLPAPPQAASGQTS